MVGERQCALWVLQSFVQFWALALSAHPTQMVLFTQISPTRDGSETQDFQRVTSPAEIVPLVERPL